MKWSNIKELLMHILFFLTACVSIFAVVLICVFLFANGIPAIGEIGVFKFLLGTKWKPGNDIYGILPMILGSLYITAGAIVIGVPIGLLTAVFMAFYCPKKLYGLLKPCTELLAGIPSIVYGFFGMVIIVPAVRAVAGVFGADISGSSILAASILLGIMILPTIIGVSEAALRAVPMSYYEGAVAMGARHERAIFTVMVPAAKSGVLAGIVLDTKSFTIRTGERTFDAAAYLRRAGADTSDVQRLFQSDLAGMVERYDITRHAERGHGDIAVAAVEKEIDRVTAAKAADELLTLSGIHASVVLYKHGTGVNLSARSLGEINVQFIMEKLGGGGNSTTAGGQVNDATVDEVRERGRASVRSPPSTNIWKSDALPHNVNHPTRRKQI